MSETHFCSSEGFIVAPDAWLPSEPFDYNWSGAPWMGCNRLQCSACGTPVQSTIKGGLRNYACKCKSEGVAYLGKSVAEVFNPMTEERLLPWTCTGHPALELPATVDGIEIRAESDWTSMARDAIGRHLFPPGADKSTSFRGFWMQRLYNILPSTVSGQVANTMATLVTGADASARVAAIHFFTTNSQAPGVERVAQAMVDQPELFVGVRDPDHEKLTLWDWIESVLSLRINSDANAERVLKERALSPPGIGSGVFTLARHRTDWLTAHARDVLSAAPHDWKLLLYSLHRKSAGVVVDLAREVANRKVGDSA